MTTLWVKLWSARIAEGTFWSPSGQPRSRLRFEPQIPNPKSNHHGSAQT